MHRWYYVLMLWMLGISSTAQAQCELLNYIPDTVQLGDCEIRYVGQQNKVAIAYEFQGTTQWLPTSYALDCAQTYIPSVWTPTWHNEQFIGFNAGCGSWCYTNILAPLHGSDSVLQGGDVLFDTTQAVFFSLYWDTLTTNPVLYVQNFRTEKEWKVNLNANQFNGAILEECLDYGPSHTDGFDFQYPNLTLFVHRKNAKAARVTFNVSEVYLQKNKN